MIYHCSSLIFYLFNATETESLLNPGHTIRFSIRKMATMQKMHSLSSGLPTG